MATFRGGAVGAFRGPELAAGLQAAGAAAMAQIADRLLQDLRNAAHVDSGEMRAGMFAVVGPADAPFDPRAGRFRSRATGRFSTGPNAGPIQLTAGTTSDHGVFELARGGNHDWLHGPIDRALAALPSALQAAVRAEGW